MADGTISKIQLPDNTIYDVVDNTSGYMTGMTILSYGSSTWQNFIDAYSSNKVVYCRASSNSNPASGSQTRLAFMAYVNNATTPTEVEFQYYRSVSSHTASQQGDQVYVYKLNKTNGWSVTVREASVKVVAGTGLGGTYSNGTMTLTGPTKVSDLTNDSGFITLNDIPTTHSIPSGGTIGQILAKNSATDYDVSWADANAGVYIVTFTYDDVNDSWSCDKTAQQIYEAYIANKIILAKENVKNSLYYLDYIDYDGQEDYYNIKFTTQTGAESEQDGVYIYNSVFYYTSDDGILQEDYSNDIINGVSDVKINNYSVVRNGVAYIPDMSNFVENFSSGDVTSFIRPWVEEGFGLIRYRDQSFNEDHTASITYGVQRESNVSYSQIGLSADKIDLSGRTSFYNGNNSNYSVYLDVPTNLANAIAITLPSNNGTLALTSDLHNIPSGGTSGQVLTKHSATNYDVEWADASAGIYVVTFTYDDVEEEWSCDKTLQEINEAYTSGSIVIAKLVGATYEEYADMVFYLQGSRYEENDYSIALFNTPTSISNSSLVGLETCSIGRFSFRYSSDDGGTTYEISFNENFATPLCGLTIMNYGESNAWLKFISAYNKKALVYCRASSNADPSSGTQTRLASMARVNNTTNPTEVEFQYYYSISPHSDSQQGDQVVVYKLTSAGTWSVTTRETSSKIVAGTGLSSSYSSGVLTLTSSGEANVQSDWSQSDTTADDFIKNKPSIPSQASDIGAQPTLVSGTNIKTINNQSLLGSGNIAVSTTAAQIIRWTESA